MPRRPSPGCCGRRTGGRLTARANGDAALRQKPTDLLNSLNQAGSIG
jgi:hypothetical protein